MRRLHATDADRGRRPTAESGSVGRIAQATGRPPTGGGPHDDHDPPRREPSLARERPGADRRPPPPAVTRSPSAVPYLPGLDGMRALAVVAVMVYHANSSWLPGGFLGVEVFFVISGYLITLLLIGEHERHGRVSLGQFWAAPRPPTAPGDRRAAGRDHHLQRAVPARHPRSATRRRPRGPHLRVELVPDLGGPGLHRVGRLRAAAAPVEPRRRGAVLPRSGRSSWSPCCGPGGTGCPASAWCSSASPLAITVVVAVVMYRGPVGTPAVTPDAYWTIGDRAISKLDFLYLSTPTRAIGLLLGAAFAMIWRPAALLRGPMRERGPAARRRRRRSGWSASARCAGTSTSSPRTVPTRGCSAAASSSPGWRRCASSPP